jgi:EPS-associated MarR family transcriptional regulator
MRHLLVLQGGSVEETLRNTPEIHLKVLRQLEGNPEMTQRQLAKSLGISLGKTNYCLRALIDQGFVRVGNSRNPENRKSVEYMLTTRGIEARARISASYLEKKVQEHAQLGAEIEQLKTELGKK